MITTRDALERLVTKIADLATSTDVPDTVALSLVRGEIGVDRTGKRPTVVTMPWPDVIDSLRSYLDAKSEVTMIVVIVRNGQTRPTGIGSVNRLHVEEVFLTLSSSAETRGNSYHVDGYDQAYVDRIADLIEAFGAASTTWRGPEVGEMAKTAVALLALIMLPVAMTLRGRQGAWLLYPASALLFAGTYLFPFGAVFNDLIITGTR